MCKDEVLFLVIQEGTLYSDSYLYETIVDYEEFEKYIFFVAYFLSPISTFSIFYNIIMVLDINLLNLRIRDSYLMTAILVYNVKDYYVHLETVS